MKSIRLVLISLHVLITILLLYNLHPHLSLVANTYNKGKQTSSIINYISHLIYISLYHFSCIFAIQHGRRYGAGMIRATGILLSGEILIILSATLEHAVEMHRVPIEEIVFDVICFCSFSAAIAITFRLAKRISRKEKDLMQLQLVSSAICEEPIGDGQGEFSLV